MTICSCVISLEKKMIILSCVIMMMNKRQEEGELWLDDNNNRNPRMKIRQKTYFETTYIFCCLISVQHGDALFGCRDVIRKSLSCKLPLFQTTTSIYILLGSQPNLYNTNVQFTIRCTSLLTIQQKYIQNHFNVQNWHCCKTFERRKLPK